MYLSYLVPSLLHQEGMIAQPEFGRPTKRHNKVLRDHTERRLIRPCGPSWVAEGNTGLFDQKTDNLSPGICAMAP